MLRNLMGSAFVAIAAIGLAMPAMAEPEMKVGVNAGMYMGQLDLGKTLGTADALPPFIDYAGELQINFSGTNGPFKAEVDVRTRTDFTNVTDGDMSDGSWNYNKVNYYEAPNATVSYTKDQATFKLGSVVIGAPFSYGSGMKLLSGTRSRWPQAANWCCSAANGFGVDYFLQPPSKDGFMMIQGGLYTSDTITSQTGQSMDAAFKGKFGPVEARVIYNTATYDDIMTTDAEGWNSTRTMVSARYTIMKGMMVSLDVMNRKRATSKDDSTDLMSTPLQFTMGNLGPGGLIFTYTPSTTTKTDATKYKQEETAMDLVYDIPLIRGSGLQLLYLTSTTKTTNARGVEGDPLSKSFMGGGMYTRF
jgi:hypothetical protein